MKGEMNSPGCCLLAAVRRRHRVIGHVGDTTDIPPYIGIAGERAKRLAAEVIRCRRGASRGGPCRHDGTVYGRGG